MKSEHVDYMTIKELAEKITDVHSFYNLKGDFLDDYIYYEELREVMVGEEPAWRNDIPNWIMPFLAAMVHKLCNDFCNPVPEWVWKDSYYLEKPRFSHDATGKMKAWLFLNAAYEFKHRNLFVSGDTLDRC